MLAAIDYEGFDQTFEMSIRVIVDDHFAFTCVYHITEITITVIKIEIAKILSHVHFNLSF